MTQTTARPTAYKSAVTEERAAQSNQASQDAANHRADGGPKALRGLHEANRGRHAIPRRRLGSHGDRQRSVAGEYALHDADRQHVPRPRHERHRRHQHHEADHRPLDHDLAAVAIAQPAPGWREQRASGPA